MTNFLDHVLKKHENRNDKYNDRTKNLTHLSQLEDEQEKLKAQRIDIIKKALDVNKIKENML